MKLVPFEMERWQSTWEHSVEFNLSESGVEPLPLRELLRDDASVEHFLNHPLAYSQGNGTPELRPSIAGMYRGATPDRSSSRTARRKPACWRPGIPPSRETRSSPCCQTTWRPGASAS